MVCFMIGLFIGVMVGFFTAALCAAAKASDREMEIYENDGNNDE